MDGSDTVFDNVSLSLEIDGERSKECKKLVEKALAKVELSDKDRAKALELSGGQKQRVCIASVWPALRVTKKTSSRLCATSSRIHSRISLHF